MNDTEPEMGHYFLPFLLCDCCVDLMPPILTVSSQFGMQTSAAVRRVLSLDTYLTFRTCMFHIVVEFHPWRDESDIIQWCHK